MSNCFPNCSLLPAVAGRQLQTLYHIHFQIKGTYLPTIPDDIFLCKLTAAVSLKPK